MKTYHSSPKPLRPNREAVLAVSATLGVLQGKPVDSTIGRCDLVRCRAHIWSSSEESALPGILAGARSPIPDGLLWRRYGEVLPGAERHSWCASRASA